MIIINRQSKLTSGIIILKNVSTVSLDIDILSQNIIK